MPLACRPLDRSLTTSATGKEPETAHGPCRAQVKALPESAPTRAQ